VHCYCCISIPHPLLASSLHFLSHMTTLVPVLSSPTSSSFWMNPFLHSSSFIPSFFISFPPLSHLPSSLPPSHSLLPLLFSFPLLSGAYTGAVSTCMLKDVGAKYVLCGHSERRTLFQVLYAVTTKLFR
jgi:hypothetical protein